MLGWEQSTQSVCPHYPFSELPLTGLQPPPTTSTHVPLWLLHLPALQLCVRALCTCSSVCVRPSARLWAPGNKHVCILSITVGSGACLTNWWRGFGCPGPLWALWLRSQVYSPPSLCFGHKAPGDGGRTRWEDPGPLNYHITTSSCRLEGACVGPSCGPK